MDTAPGPVLVVGAVAEGAYSLPKIRLFLLKLFIGSIVLILYNEATVDDELEREDVEEIIVVGNCGCRSVCGCDCGGGGCNGRVLVRLLALDTTARLVVLSNERLFVGGGMGGLSAMIISRSS